MKGLRAETFRDDQTCYVARVPATAGAEIRKVSCNVNLTLGV